jgi:uncharacterized protein (TIGR03435 family)
MVRILIAPLIVAAAAGPRLWAQTPAFEVATVKVNHSGSGRSNSPRLTNGRLWAENATLKQILQVAYDLSALRITGPDWLDSDRYDLTGKAPQGVPDTELMPMLQSLIRDRFQLAAHRASREMAVYNLVVAKDGLKLSPYDPAHPLVPPPRNGAASMVIGVGTMAQLASMLTGSAGRPVLDKTGIEGRYGYALTFSPLAAQASPDTASDSGPLDLFAAVQQQLGLKLEPKKDTIEILIVDHAERVPSEN